MRSSTTDFRVIARKKGAQVRLYSRPGNDLTYRFPLIVETLARLRSRSCIIDGEAVACDENGVTSFNRVRYRHHDESIFLYAFDLIELNGDDLRPNPLEARKATLELILFKAGPGIRFNEHMEGDGETVFRHACKLGLEGIVSKRKDFCLSFWPLARLAQDEERRCAGSEVRRGGRMGQQETAVTNKNRIMIYGPKNDGTYVIEFRTAVGEALAISVPRGPPNWGIGRRGSSRR
jgi:ATP dependent DNA ligase domain